MTGEDHIRKAEELAAKAQEHLGQGEGQQTAAAWAAVAQVHALLALAEAAKVSADSAVSQVHALRNIAAAARVSANSAPSAGSRQRPDTLSEVTESRSIILNTDPPPRP
jgi:hypothetical protein